MNKKNFKFDDYRFGDREAEIDGDEELKDYLRIMYDQIKFDNRMVGEFTIYGTYKIRPEMQDYLIKSVKKIRGVQGDTVYAQGADDRFVMNFIITFKIVGKSQQAFLDFEEREVRIDEENIFYKTRLAEITKSGHPDFVNYVYHEWNVWGTSITELEDNPLLRGLLDRLAMYGMLTPMLSKNSLIFVKSMLSLLPNCGPTGKLIVTQFNDLLQQMGAKNPGLMNDGLGLKKLLDSLMKKHDFFPKLAQIKEIRPLVKDFVNPIKSIDMSRDKGADFKKMEDLSAGMGMDRKP